MTAMTSTPASPDDKARTHPPDSAALPEQGPLAFKARLSYQLTLISLGGLILLFACHYFWLLPASHPWTVFAVHSLPLLLFLPGLISKKPRVFAWLCFVVLLYFCEGSMNSFYLPHRLGVLSLIEAILTITLFCSAMMASRYWAQLNQR